MFSEYIQPFIFSGLTITLSLNYVSLIKTRGATFFCRVITSNEKNPIQIWFDDHISHWFLDEWLELWNLGGVCRLRQMVDGDLVSASVTVWAAGAGTGQLWTCATLPTPTKTPTPSAYHPLHPLDLCLTISQSFWPWWWQWWWWWWRDDNETEVTKGRDLISCHQRITPQAEPWWPHGSISSSQMMIIVTIWYECHCHIHLMMMMIMMIKGIKCDCHWM